MRLPVMTGEAVLMRLSGRRRAGAMLAAVAVAAAMTAGCQGPSFTQDEAQTGTEQISGDSAEGGYQSSDGTTVVFPVDQRPGPIALAGTAYDGTAIDVSDYRGEVVVINLWFAACPPCQAEIGALVALANERADQEVHVIGLNTMDDPETVSAFSTEFDVPYPSIDDRKAAAIGGLDGVVPLNQNPSTVVLARDGRVFGRVVGMISPDTLNAMVDGALAEDDGAAGP